MAALLRQLELCWKSAQFSVVVHQSSLFTRNLLIFGPAEHVFELLEESKIKMTLLNSSKHVEHIQSGLEAWNAKLQLAAECLELWFHCQTSCLYLEKILVWADFELYLPNESRLFKLVEKTWMVLLRQVQDSPSALNALIRPGVLESLEMCRSHLEQMRKSLEDYLEIKRASFPRFFFLSNEELLEMMVRGRNPRDGFNISKCFTYIASIEFSTPDVDVFSRDKPDVLAIISQEGEHVLLRNRVKIRGNFDIWCGALRDAMVHTLRAILCDVMKNPRSHCTSVIDLILAKVPSQLVSLVTRVFWNRDVLKCMTSQRPKRKKELSDLKLALEMQLKSLVAVLQSPVDTMAPSQLTPNPSNIDDQHLNGSRKSGNGLSHVYITTVSANILVLIHLRDSTDLLVSEKAFRADDFTWLRQTRVEWDETTTTCYIRQGLFNWAYGFEYLGAAHHFVVTPLTERCFLTLTTALNFHFGGLLSGGPGSGKTDTVTGLARTLGKMCIVWNCADHFEFGLFNNVFLGMVLSGVWCTFNHVNRVNLAVLSVVAQQLRAIKMALSHEADRVILDWREVRLDSSTACFFTLNHTQGGTDLPGNFRSLFRPVTLTTPDTTCIVESYLVSKGFTTAGVLARRLVIFFSTTPEFFPHLHEVSVGLLRSLLPAVQLACSLRQETLARGSGVDSGSEANGKEDSEEIYVTKSLWFLYVTKLPVTSHAALLSLLKRCFPQSHHLLQSSLVPRSGVVHCSETPCLFGSGPGSNIQVCHGHTASLPSRGPTCGEELLVVAAAPEGIAAEKLQKSFDRTVDCDGTDLRRRIHEACVFLKYTPTEYQATKAVDLHALLSRQHSAILLGSAGVGKTVTYKILAMALKLPSKVTSDHSKKIDSSLTHPGTDDPACPVLPEVFSASLPGSTNVLRGEPLYPGANLRTTSQTNATEGVPRSFAQVSGVELVQTAEPDSPSGTLMAPLVCVISARFYSSVALLGYTDPVTTLWNDGILTTLIRACINDNDDPTSPTQKADKWIVCDGLVGGGWYDTLTLAIDSTRSPRVYCCANRERICLPDNLKFLFETESLRGLSPASIGRCSVLLFEDSLGWSPLVCSWVPSFLSDRSYPASLLAAVHAYTTQLISSCFPDAFAFIKLRLLETPRVGQVARQPPLLFVASFCAFMEAMSHESTGFNLDSRTSVQLIFGSITRIFVFCFIWAFGGNLAAGARPAFDVVARGILSRAQLAGVHIPTAKDVFSYCVDPVNGAFVPWEANVPRNLAPTLDFIPTPETTCYTYLIHLLMRSGKHVLLSGSVGTGKTIIARHVLATAPPDTTCATIQMTPGITGSLLQVIIYINCVIIYQLYT